MFIDDKEMMDVVVYYKRQGHDYEAYTKAEFDTIKMEDEEKKKFDVVNIKASVLTWGVYNDLQDSAMIINIDGDRRFNYKIYKENRLKKMVQEWDAKDKEGNPVKENEANMMKLSPIVAEAILRGLDESSFVSEEEENL